MTSRQTRIATACQQLLALGAVVALLLPAANVVSLDVIGETPHAAPAQPTAPESDAAQVPAGATDAAVGSQEPAADPVEPITPAVKREIEQVTQDSAAATDATQSSRVAAAPTEASVTEYDLTTVSGEPTQAPDQEPGLARKTMPQGAKSPSRAAGDEPSDAATPEGSPSPQATASASAPAAPEQTPTASGTQTAHPGNQVVGGATVETLSDGRTQLTAAPQQVKSFGTVGVTWDEGQQVDESTIEIQVRSNTGGTWSEWSDLEYHDEHGPEVGSAEADASGVRAGTDPTVVGRVDQVQVRTVTTGAAPKGLRMAVVEPEEDAASAPTAVEAPAIDTADLETPASALPADGSQEEAPADETTQDALALSSGEISLAASIKNAKQPVIYSRAQWGANEKIRDTSSLRYGTISGAFVHHTVNGNDYTANDVPGIIRSIYSFHVKSRGWSDVGYNFLIDKFGRIWEGRYGGVTKAVVGAHTLNYNDYSFAASAIGNFETVKPSEAMVNAYASLFAWKLGANNVSAAGKNQKIGRKVFASTINGHRDAASTACPGRYLYARIGDIRTRAAALQTGTGGGNTNNGGTNNGGNGTNNGGNGTNNGTNLGNNPWTGATIRSTLTSSAYPSLVAVRQSDKKAVVLQTGGLTNFGGARVLSKGWAKARFVQLSPDLTGDGRADLVYLNAKGVLRVRKGLGNGRFGASLKAVADFKAFRNPQAGGDLTGDRRPDLMAWHRKNGRLHIFPGTGKGTFGKPRALGKASANYTRAVAAGDLTSDGRPDILGITRTHQMVLHRGLAGGKFSSPKAVPGSWGYTSIAGGSDFTRDGRPDLVARDSSGRLFVFPSVGNGTFSAALGPAVTVAPAVDGLSTAGNLVDGAGSDLVGRVGDNLMVMPNADTYELAAPIETGQAFSAADVVLNAGDWDKDGNGDVITRSGATGALYVWRGIGNGRLATGKKIGGAAFKTMTNMSVIGDVTGDGFPDLVATEAGKTWIYPGNGLAGLKPRIAAPVGAIMKLPVNTSGYDWLMGVASLTRGAKADVVARERGTGRLYVLESRTNYAGRRLLAESLAGYDLR